MTMRKTTIQTQNDRINLQIVALGWVYVTREQQNRWFILCLSPNYQSQLCIERTRLTSGKFFHMIVKWRQWWNIPKVSSIPPTSKYRILILGCSNCDKKPIILIVGILNNPAVVGARCEAHRSDEPSSEVMPNPCTCTITLVAMMMMMMMMMTMILWFWRIISMVVN